MLAISVAFTPSQLRQPHFELPRWREVNTGTAASLIHVRTHRLQAGGANASFHARALRDAPPVPPRRRCPFVGHQLSQAEAFRSWIRFPSHRFPEAAGRGGGGEGGPLSEPGLF